MLHSILPIENPKEYKLHLATWNNEDHPLDVFVKDRKEWDGWNSWRGTKDDFSRNYIFSLIDFYPEKDTWLFGGIYKVLSRNKKNNAHSYEIELDTYRELIGRLKFSFKRPSRTKAFYLESYYDALVVSEILKDSYSGEVFCGYESINHDFAKLEVIFKSEKPDWKAALRNIKGVYLIVDKSNGKKYVGSAYGDEGIWSRWSSYMVTGHGWNEELKRLIQKEGMEYARKNFRLSLLEHRSMKTDDNVIIERENFWKEALLTRGCFGYNKN